MSIKIKPCPSWATSMVSNYRAQYKSKFGCDTILNDDQIFGITETVYDDTSNEDQDDARVDVMAEMEKELGNILFTTLGEVKAYLKGALQAFDRDPPNSNHQEGYKAALEELQKRIKA